MALRQPTLRSVDSDNPSHRMSRTRQGMKMNALLLGQHLYPVGAGRGHASVLSDCAQTAPSDYTVTVSSVEPIRNFNVY